MRSAASIHAPLPVPDSDRPWMTPRVGDRCTTILGTWLQIVDRRDPNQLSTPTGPRIVYTTERGLREACWIQAWQEWCKQEAEDRAGTYTRDPSVPVVRR